MCFMDFVLRKVAERFLFVVSLQAGAMFSIAVVHEHYILIFIKAYQFSVHLCWYVTATNSSTIPVSYKT